MIGSRLGSYEITAKLGEGGMGEVYRATDTKLERQVAIKVLPAAFTEDKERLARFEREAKLLAQLHHPNIASIFGLEESDGTRALVMELVEGPTLAERLEKGALPLDESLSIARQIAEALEEAHGRGIVHRDLKPQNVKASFEGKVKVLDFGLAKAMDPASGSVSAADLARSPTIMNSPTMTAAGTQLGVILGTAAYMAPEQARGGAIDKRADIWAFGVVLYEMLGGRSLFAGPTVSDTLAGVLKTEIDWNALPASTPAAIRRLLRRCLERNPKQRLHDIADARLVIDDLLAGRTEAAPGLAPAVPKRSRAGWAAAAAAGVAVGALAGWLSGRSGGSVAESSATPEARFRQLTREPGGERQPSLAPDGESFAFVKAVGGQRDIFVQRVNGRIALNLTADCAGDDFDPTFSPDGQWIAYASTCRGGGLFVMGATGESARRVADRGFSPSWSPDGKELAVVDARTDAPWAVSGNSPLWAVNVDTGERRLVSQRAALAPAWSPNGRRIAFWGLQTGGYQRDLWTVAADGSAADPEQAVAVTSDAALDCYPAWAPGGDALYFVSTRSGAFNLWRVALDGVTGEVRGRPVPVPAPSGWAGWPSPSRDGRRLLFVDRNARTAVVRAAFDPVARRLAGPVSPVFQGSFELHDQAVSPDGAWILFSNAGQPANLHLVRADGTGYRQLIEGEFRDRQGHWSPDGRTIAFQTSRWVGGLALVGVDGSGLREVPIGGPDSIWEPRWSPDGTKLAVTGNQRFLVVDLATAPPAVHEHPRPDAESVFNPVAWLPSGDAIFGSVLPHGNWHHYGVYSLSERTYRSLPALSAPDEPAQSGKLVGSDYPTLLPDGSGFLLPEGNRLLLAGIGGGSVRELHRAPVDHVLQRPSLSSDGRWLTFLEIADESDIWVAEFETGEQEAER